MLGRATAAVLTGVDARLIDVEVDLGGGLPTIAAVGLPDSAIREGIDRIRASLRHGGFRLPQRRVTVSLAPAEQRKHGAALDLPIAGALLAADGQLPPLDAARDVVVGELSLDGRVRPVRGALAIALAARAAGRTRLVVPAENAEEAALVEGIEVVPVRSLRELAAVARGELASAPRPDVAALLARAGTEARIPDLRDVRGQVGARRALEIAAAGGHHLLLSGPPGSGKSMLARRLAGVLPPLDVDEALEVTRVWGAAGLARGLVARRPFRAPHHGVSLAGLTGGGSLVRPGEISLASRGVLYLDEITEFRRDALEALRQPLEDGSIAVVRVRARAEMPAAFTLVASMNPCPCGRFGSGDGSCACSPAIVQRYRARLSGPLLDRFDLVVDVPPVDVGALSDAAPGESSVTVRARVIRARELQRERFTSGPAARGRSRPAINGAMGPAELARHVELGPGPRRMLRQAAERLALSARGYDRVRRVARTVADLDGEPTVGELHVAEALRYRRRPAGPR